MVVNVENVSASELEAFYWQPRTLALGEQVVMSSRIGIDEATFSRMIHAATWPSQRTFEKIARCLGTDIPGAVAWVWAMRKLNRSTVIRVTAQPGGPPSRR